MYLKDAIQSTEYQVYYQQENMHRSSGMITLEYDDSLIELSCGVDVAEKLALSLLESVKKFKGG